MRLKDDKESAAECLARRLQRGRDLARMMGIVGDQFGAVQFSQPFEAAANAAKAGQSHRRQRRRKAALFGDRRGSERIVDVVLAVNIQADAAARLAMNIQCKGVSPPGRAQAQGAHVTLFRKAECQSRTNGAANGIVPAHDGGGSRTRIRRIRIEQSFGTAITLEMIRIGIEDDGDRRAQFPNVAAVLAHLRDEAAVAALKIAAIIEILSPDMGCAAAACLQYMRAHGCCRRLAVAAGDADRDLKTGCDERKQFGSIIDGDPGGTRGGELGIALRHSGTVYDRVRSGRALGRMAADKRNAAGFQLGGTLVSAKVAAGNGKSCRQQAGSQRAHADTAHSNEINFLLFRPKFPLHGINIC